MGRPTVRFVGERRHNLEVLEIYPQNKGGRHIQLKLLCHACAKTTIQSSVVFKKAKSCGCQRHNPSAWKSVGPKRMPWQLPEGEAAKRLLIIRYKRSAKNKGLSFDLSEDHCGTLFKSTCSYCGQAETNVSKGLGKTSGDYPYVGLDRINPSLGYTEENVVPCCWVCNMMKNTLERDYFLAHIKKIAVHRGLNE
jgi:hypothetical protein